MKKTIFLIVFCAGSMMLFAQQNRYQNAPDQVRRSYQREYPNYNDNTWDMRDNQWHTRYMDRDHGNRYVDIYYDRRGRRMKSQMEWNRNDLPPQVRDRIRNRYHYDNDNYQVYRIERPGRGIFFQISLGRNRVIYMDERGREVRYY